MKHKRDTKSGKLLLISAGVSLLASLNSLVRFNSVVSQTKVLHPSFQRPATFVVALDPRASLNLPFYQINTCAPQSNSPMNRAHIFKSEHKPATSGFSIVSGNTSEAICLFDETQPSHFPHAMQQLYVCFSFWNAHSMKQPILAVDETSLRKLRRQRLTDGFIQALEVQKALKILVIANKTVFEGIKNSATLKPFMVHNRGFDASSYKELNKHLTAHFRLNDTSSDSCSCPKPRIGILNRANYSGRSILNAEDIATASAGLSRDEHVTIGYFETLKFDAQLAFFRSVDILISPHGAQLTGLAFMDSPCGHLLEIFPKHYAIPHYFGTLAMTTGKRYSYVYMSNSSFLREQAPDKLERKSVRIVNFCLSVATILGYLQQLVEDWKNCCRSICMGMNCRVSAGTHPENNQNSISHRNPFIYGF